MNISDRLKTIAGMVNRCNSIADIGTDHGYIPIFLIKNNVCERAIASDINKGPVQRAQRNIKLEGMEGSIECRLGGGLSTIREGEVDGAVIAGMGGYLMIDILEEHPKVVEKFQFMVLQPVQHSEILRKYLYERGYEILGEELCYDEGKYYEIIKARFDNKPKFLEDIYYEVSPILLEQKHPLLKEYLQFKIDRNAKVVDTITEDTENAVKRREGLVQRNYKLKEMLQWL